MRSRPRKREQKAARSDAQEAGREPRRGEHSVTSRLCLVGRQSFTGAAPCPQQAGDKAAPVWRGGQSPIQPGGC